MDKWGTIKKDSLLEGILNLHCFIPLSRSIFGYRQKFASMMKLILTSWCSSLTDTALSIKIITVDFYI